MSALRELDEESEMDFVERIFHVSPDGGNGLTELLLLLILAIAAIAVAALRGKHPQQD